MRFDHITDDHISDMQCNQPCKLRSKPVHAVGCYSLMPVKFSYSLSQLRKLCGCRVPLVKFDKRNERGADIIDPSLFAQFGKIPSEGCK